MTWPIGVKVKQGVGVTLQGDERIVDSNLRFCRDKGFPLLQRFELNVQSAAPFEGPSQGHLVSKLQIATDRQATC